MRYFLFILLIVFLFVDGITAQDDDPDTQNNCDLPICIEIETDWSQFNYTTGCDNGYYCAPENFQLFHLAVSSELSSDCDFDDAECRNIAFLRATAIFVYDNPLGDQFNWGVESADAFAQVLSLVENGNFDDALTVLLDAPLANSQNTLLMHSRGLVYELLNQPTMALQTYEDTLNLDNHHLATIYARGLLYGRLGHHIEASFVSVWFEDYLTAFAPDQLFLVNPLFTHYPPDRDRATDWIRYPVTSSAVSPVGGVTTDLTKQHSTPVQLSFYSEPDVILAVDVSELRYPRDIGDVVNTYVLRQTENGRYTYEFEGFGEQLGFLDFRLDNGIIWGEETLREGEGHLTSKFILAPVGNPDPRSAFDEPACEGGVISRLRPGMRITPQGAFYYAATPGGVIDPDLYFDDGNRGDMTDPDTYPWLIIRLTENRLCIGNQLWWEVTDGQGNFGWRPENVELDYDLFSPNFNELFFCPDIPTTRLFVTSIGVVIPGFGANNLRVEPDLNSEQIGTIPENAQFTVVDGPECANGMAWWQVEYGDISGWTAEGQGNTYWLEPLLPQ